KLLHRERLTFLSMRAAAYSADGAQFAAIGLNGAVRIWSSTDFKAVRRLQGEDYGFGLAYSPTGDYLAMRDTKGVKVFEASTGRLVEKLPAHPMTFGPVVFSPDGKQIATANSGGAVTIWGLKSKKLIPRLTGHPAAVTGLAFSPDGTRLASSSH